MLESFRDHMQRHHMTHVAGALLGLAAAAVLALVMVAAPAGPAQARLDAHIALAPSAPRTLTPVLRVATAAAPTRPSIRLQALDLDQARRWRTTIRADRAPNPAAKPFELAATGALDEMRAIDCMTAAIYYEAAAESLEGQRAIAQVVLNRVRHPAFPKSVCGVVFQTSAHGSGCQFSFTCNGALARRPAPQAWARARQIAEAALHGYVMRAVGEATHYHAVYVAPSWSPALVRVSTIGAHVFYRWTGRAGRPPAFAGTYAGAEPLGVQVAALDDPARKSARLTPAAAPADATTRAPVAAEPAAAASPAQPVATAVVAQAAGPGF